MHELPRDEAWRADHAFLRRIARGLLHDAHEAEDLAQEVWLVSLRRDGVRTPTRNVLVWLARNLAVDRQRMRSRRFALERRQSPPDALPTPIAEVERDSIRQRVLAAVNGLREPYRTAIMLRFFDDLEANAIADRLGLPIETVRTRVKRGLALLEEELDRRSNGDRRSWLEGLMLLSSGLPRSSVGKGGWVSVGLLASLAGLGGVWLTWNEPSRIEAPSSGQDAGTVLAWTPEFERETRREARPTAGGSVHLRVEREDDGSPIPGASVRVGTDAGELVLETDTDGVCAFPFVRTAEIEIAATRATQAKHVVVEPDALERELVVAVAPGFVLSGLVLDESDRPAASARVLAHAGDAPVLTPSGIPPAQQEATCDARGRFELVGLPAQFFVHAERDGLVSSGGVLARLRPLAPALPVVLRLERPRTIAGCILDEEDVPVAGALIELQGGGDSSTSKRPVGAMLVHVDQIACRVESGPDGRFLMAGLPSSVGLLRVSHPGFVPREAVVNRDDWSGEIVLEQGAFLDVRALDHGGAPLAGARLSAFRPVTGTILASTDELGHARLGPFSLGDVLNVRVDATDFAPASRRTAIEAERAELVFDLSRPRVLSGRVLDSSDLGLAGARIVARSVADRSSIRDELLDLCTAVTAPDGTFELAELPTVELMIEVSPGSLGTSTRFFTVAAQEVRPLLRMAVSENARVVRGHIRDALDRAPLGPEEHTGIRAFEDGGALRTVHCMADERGAYEIILPRGYG